MRTRRKSVRTRRSPLLAALLLVAVPSPAMNEPYQLALPGYHYAFPRDYFSHPAFQTEWWYYTGNLVSADGRRFGFELTFFRQGVGRDAPKSAAWDVRDVYLAHLALSDLSSGHFYHTERTNRSGPGIAGADDVAQRIWNGNWQIAWKDADQQLQAIADNFELHFTLHLEKQPVIHGENGVSQKAEGHGRGSHYISLTRLATNGSITLNGKMFEVSGLAWMDHEFFTHQLSPDQAGWDWLSVQLDDRTELMLFHIRRKDNSIDAFSSGTYVDAQGKSTHLRKEDFVLRALGDNWKSPVSGAAYPIRWKIAVPKLGLELDASTPLASQELTGNSALVPTYWEGAITFTGSRDGQPVRGAGYLEMTGYDHPVTLAP
jgi:predicted secreted hydrolase